MNDPQDSPPAGAPEHKNDHYQTFSLQELPLITGTKQGQRSQIKSFLSVIIGIGLLWVIVKPPAVYTRTAVVPK